MHIHTYSVKRIIGNSGKHFAALHDANMELAEQTK